MGLLDGMSLGEVLDENNGRINDCAFQKAKNLQLTGYYSPSMSSKRGGGGRRLVGRGRPLAQRRKKPTVQRQQLEGSGGHARQISEVEGAGVVGKGADEVSGGREKMYQTTWKRRKARMTESIRFF